MSWDTIKVFIDAKKAYVGMRGAVRGTGLVPVSKAVPRTTWGDVLNFGTTFLSQTRGAQLGSNETLEQCIDRLSDQPWYLTAVEESIARDQCTKHITGSYLGARAQWQSWQPMEMAGGLTGALKVVARYDDVYPWNEQFWGYGSRYAIARSAAGSLPGQWYWGVDAVKDALDELPGRVGSAIDAAVPSITLPSFGIDWKKWGFITVAGVAGWWWWKERGK